MTTLEIFNIGSGQYIRSPTKINTKLWTYTARPHAPNFSNGIAYPATIVNYPYPNFTLSLFDKVIKGMLEKDDVLNKGFFSTIVVQGLWVGNLGYEERENFFLTPLRSLGLSSDRIACYESDGYIVPEGPYFWYNDGLYPALRLLEDPYGAFVCGVLQSGDDRLSYTSLPTPHIPLPSRLSFPAPTASLPLSGKRIAIKDIFSLVGVVTTASCKSYAACYPPAEKTSSKIQKLIDLGAVIVGKTKTAPLASGLVAVDWVDHQAPWNPRGDGYLDPDCSSSGSAVAVAGYEWLDFAVGSDTLGSMVGPAAVNGVYGIRPTHGLQELDGTLLVSTMFDTAGIFARDVQNLLHVTNVWYGQISTEETPKKSFRGKILFPKERFDPYPESVFEVMIGFISDLEKVLGIQTTLFDIAALWDKIKPAGIKEPVGKYIGTTLAHIQLYDSYHNNEKFRTDHKAKFGYEAYVEPMIRYKWDLGAKLTNEAYDKACAEREIFREFLLKHVFADGSVMLLPGGYPGVTYRDGYTESFEDHGWKFQGFGFKDTAFSVLGGLPCISFPIGQVKYKSKVTNLEEYQPVSLMLLGAPGTDSLLIGLIERVLETSNRKLSVKVGKMGF